MNITNLFKLDYWFSQPYIARGWLATALWAVVLGLVLAGVVVFVWRYYETEVPKKELLRRYGTLALTAGICGVIWLWLRQQIIPVLAWRFWILPAAGVFAYWLVTIIRYTRQRLPTIKAEQALKARRERYLPKPKR